VKRLVLEARHVSVVAAGVAALCAILVVVQTAHQPREVEIRHDTVVIPAETLDDEMNNDGESLRDGEACAWTNAKPDCPKDDNAPI
jgi:hypothetical protein